jgi:mannose-6-phosphate isomerase-like protein (cupin superfamily)
MSKYSQYVITELKAPNFSGEAIARYNTFGRRILWVDKNVVPGAFQMNCSWYLKSLPKGPPAHTHDFDEILGFFSGDYQNPYDLGGEVEMWLEGEKHLITQSALVYIPAGMNHCPLNLNRIDRPVFHFSVVTAGEYIVKPTTENKNPQPTYREHIVTELKEPEERKRQAPVYNQYAKRVLWLDTDVVKHSFNINVSWYLKASTTVDDKPHTHTHDEIIGFCSNDPQNLNDLGGDVEIWVGDEKFNITKSAMLFIPAGMVHCPLVLKRVTRPIFHFTVVKAPRYIKYEKEN